MSRCRRSWISHQGQPWPRRASRQCGRGPACRRGRRSPSGPRACATSANSAPPTPLSATRTPTAPDRSGLFSSSGRGRQGTAGLVRTPKRVGSGNAADGGEIGQALGPLHANLKHWEYHPDRAGKEAHTSPVLYFFESDDSHTWEFVAVMPFRCCYLDWLYFTGIRTDRLAFPVAVAPIPVTAR